MDKRICVIGMGYVGIPIAVMLADAGYQVTGIQRRSTRSGWKIDWLNEGKCPIGGNEPELPQMLEKVIRDKRFSVTSDLNQIMKADIILVDVQTETDVNHTPKYEPLQEACRNVGKALCPGKVVIIESTVAPGTTEYLVKPILESESGLKCGLPGGFGLCFAYERVMVGRLVHNIREYPKVIGSTDFESGVIAKELYQSVVKQGVFVTDIMTAEVSKTVENAYRDVQIAFANEVALVCESLGVDVYNVRNLVNGLPNDPSVPHANPVRNMHFPGAGVGGHCLPKDSWLLLYGYNKYAKDKTQYPLSILEDARHLNDYMPLHMVDLLERALQSVSVALKGAKIGVLGYAFLENSDDARNTPTLILVKELSRRGATFTIHDPYVKNVDEYHIETNLESALKGCDAIVLMTKHEIYKTITPQKINSLLKNKVIIDGRNIFSPDEYTQAGFVFAGVGKGSIAKTRS